MFLWILMVFSLGYIEGIKRKRPNVTNVKNKCNGILIDYGLSCRAKMKILDVHNKLRNLNAGGGVSGQPPAANMVELTWDEQLARKAQTWADRCTFMHDPELKLGGKMLGQNLFIRMSGTASLRDDDMSKGVHSWFNEVHENKYDGTYNPLTGHYSQVIWAKTTRIGCGFSYYKDSDYYKNLFVCNYEPGGNLEEQVVRCRGIENKNGRGNVQGQGPYIHGKKSCMTYKLHNSKKYSNLCEMNIKAKKKAPKCQNGYFRGKLV